MLFVTFMRLLVFLMPSFINAQLCTTCLYPTPPSTVPSVAGPVAIAFSPNGCLAVANQLVATVTLYAITSDCTLPATPSATIAGFGSGALLSALAFSPNGCLAVAYTSTALPSGALNLYTITPNCNSAIHIPPNITNMVADPITQLAFSPSGSCIAVGNQGTVFGGPNVLLYPVSPSCIATNTPITSPAIASNGGVLAISANGCLAASNLDGEALSLYSVDSACISTFKQAITNETPLGDPFTVSAAAFSPNGSCLAIAFTAPVTTPITPNVINLYAINPTTCTATLVGPSIEQSAVTTSLAFSPNGSCLAVANSNSSTLSVYSISSNCTVNNPTTPSQVTVPANAHPTVAFSPNGCLAYLDIDTSVELFSPDIIVATKITGAFVTCLSTVTIVGTGRANATIALFLDGVQVATTIASASGNFTFSNIPVTTGTHCFVAVDTAAGCFSSPVCVTAISSCALPVPNLAFGTHC